MTVQTAIPQNQSSPSGEAPFAVDELFYSRTDERGVILEANSVFLRVAGYSWDELRGAPHKIIRHPDMPKGVFYLLWSRLKAGKPVVAYVKNKAKDGRYYWVLATVWPVDGGYLSVRLKPTSPQLDTVKALYAKALAAERDGLSPEASATQLGEMLAEAGFPSYDSFMTRALSQEQEYRSKARGRSNMPIAQSFGEMHETVAELGAETDALRDLITTIRTVPTNLRILSTRLETIGGSIGAISANYGSMLDEMAAWTRDFISGDKSAFASIYRAIEQARFLVCAAALQREMAQAFEEDMIGHPEASEHRGALENLRAEAASYDAQVKVALRTVETEISRLSRSMLDMKRYVTGLNTTRMMCKIESAALSGTGDGTLSSIVDRLDSGQDEIEERLSRIMQRNSVIQGQAGALRAMA